MIRFIGDVHGQLNIYQSARLGAERTFQVGDFGFGFAPDHKIGELELGPDHRFIRGNHDDPKRAAASPGFVPSGLTPDGLFAINGGLSIDKQSLLVGVDWWPDEEHSYKELGELIALYEQTRPDTVVAHEAPASIVPILFPHLVGLNRIDSRTSKAMDVMMEIHRPKLWIFGHYHVDISTLVTDTEFCCIAPASYKDYDL